MHFKQSKYRQSIHHTLETLSALTYQGFRVIATIKNKQQKKQAVKLALSLSNIELTPRQESVLNLSNFSIS